MLILCRIISERRYEALTKSPKTFASGTARTRPRQQQPHSYSVQEPSSLHTSFQQYHRMFSSTAGDHLAILRTNLACLAGYYHLAAMAITCSNVSAAAATTGY
jgi:hypothetical protein